MDREAYNRILSCISACPDSHPDKAEALATMKRLGEQAGWYDQPQTDTKPSIRLAILSKPYEGEYKSAVRSHSQSVTNQER
jgi:hypothetical protein